MFCSLEMRQTWIKLLTANYWLSDIGLFTPFLPPHLRGNTICLSHSGQYEGELNAQPMRSIT